MEQVLIQLRMRFDVYILKKDVGNAERIMNIHDMLIKGEITIEELIKNNII